MHFKQSWVFLFSHSIWAFTFFQMLCVPHFVRGSPFEPLLSPKLRSRMTLLTFSPRGSPVPPRVTPSLPALPVPAALPCALGLCSLLLEVPNNELFSFPTAAKGAAFQELSAAASAFSCRGGEVGGVVLHPAPAPRLLLLRGASLLQTEHSERGSSSII